MSWTWLSSWCAWSTPSNDFSEFCSRTQKSEHLTILKQNPIKLTSYSATSSRGISCEPQLLWFTQVQAQEVSQGITNHYIYLFLEVFSIRQENFVNFPLPPHSPNYTLITNLFLYVFLEDSLQCSCKCLREIFPGLVFTLSEKVTNRVYAPFQRYTLSWFKYPFL